MAKSRTVGTGTRLQTGIERRPMKDGTGIPNGLLLKGAIIATYVTDDPRHPKFLDVQNKPAAVYCDVLAYPSLPNQRWFALKQVLVSQKRGGLHDDDLWKPKATTMNIVTQVLDNTISANPGQLDGDHVLIGFMNNSFDEPVILKGLPHPSRDVGNDLYPAGKRLKLKLIDGIKSPDFDKYQGVFRGVDALGNHVVDSTFGNNGILLPLGIEPPPDILGISGNQSRKLPENATHEVVFYNMAVPLVPVETARFQCTKDAFEMLLTFLPTLKVEGSLLTAKLTLGSGAVSAVIASHMETLWGLMKAWLALHTHQDSTGGQTLVPTQAATVPSWTPTCTSSKMLFPDG